VPDNLSVSNRLDNYTQIVTTAAMTARGLHWHRRALFTNERNVFTNKEIFRMSKLRSFLSVAGLSLAIVFSFLAAHVEGQETTSSDLTIDQNAIADFVAPAVFQAAGPNIASIESCLTDFRNALGGPNGNATSELPSGRREINWDGAAPTDVTTPPVNPFNAFLNTRGAQFTTPGIGLSQAPPSGGPQGGLATLFGNPTYATEFRAFSAARLFTPVGSNITDTFFFVAGSNGSVRAAVTGFGVIFTDVDQPNGSGPGTKRGNRGSSTLVQYFDANGRLLFSSFAPASPGNGGFSFLGIKFDDPRIASVRITAGDVAPGPNDNDANDVVMMDDFIYGEPHTLSQP
jgi:hypothetical protein